MRDLEVYLKLCEAATPGPWEFDEYGIIYRKNEQNGIDILFSRWADGNWYRGKIEDWKLAAAARTGWPETIKLAQQYLRWWHDEAEMCQKAEKERDELKKRAEQLETALETAIATLSTINWDSVQCPKDMGTISDEDKCRYACEGQERIECWKRYFLAEEA